MGIEGLSSTPSRPTWPLVALIVLGGAALNLGAVPARAQRQAFPLAPQPVQPAQSPQRVSTPTTGLVTIESDLQRADNKTGVITATGNVRIVYPDQRVVATARQAQYFSQEGRVILSGDVDIVQTDGHAMRAERVIYDVNTERLLAQPPAGKQVFSKVRMPAPSGDKQAAKAATPSTANPQPKRLLPPAASSQP